MSAPGAADVPRCGKCGRYPIDHRGGECIYPPDVAAYRAALEVAREAIGIPHAATLGDDRKRAEILQVRVMHAVIMLDSVLDPAPGADAARDVRYCRERLAEQPAGGYRTWDEAMAAQRAAKIITEGTAAEQIGAGLIEVDADALCGACGGAGCSSCGGRGWAE